MNPLGPLEALCSGTSGGGQLAAPYSDDVFSSYTYTGNGTTNQIINNIGLANTSAWSVGRLSQNSSIGNAVCTDSTGNFYAAGLVNNAGVSLGLISKYNSSGAIQWQRTLQQNLSILNGVATDSSGNVYVVGAATDGTNYIITAKYNSSGVIQWQRKLSAGASNGLAIAVDTSDNVYITGIASTGSTHMIIAKYNSSGTIQWQRKLTSINAQGKSIAVDTSGNVYAGGQFSSGGSNFLLLTKYNTSGTIQWQRTLQQNASSCYGVTVDISGNVYITGACFSSSEYILTAKYNSAGAIQWQRKLQQGVASTNARAIITDASGNVYVSGHISGNLIVLKYNSSGTLQWQRKMYTGAGSPAANGIATDTLGNVYVTGSYPLASVNQMMIVRILQDGTSTAGTVDSLILQVGSTTDTAGTATEAAAVGLTDAASTATEAAGTATEAAGTATYTLSSQTAVSGNGGLVWLKNRALAADPIGNVLYDTVRGEFNAFTSNNPTASTSTSPNGLSAFDISGFTVSGASADSNSASANFSSWTFREAPKFFDIVTYTGNGGASQVVPHSLGQAPGMMIVRQTNATSNWVVYHRGSTAPAQNNGFIWTATSGESASTSYWNNTAPTSSNFTVGGGSFVNANGIAFTAYLFSHDTSTAGVIQCSSFTTDGSGNATVSLGWEPQALYTKTTTATSDWVRFDTSRALNASGSDLALFSNTNGAEAAATTILINSTGFTTSGLAASTAYIFMAIRRPNKPPTSGTQVFQPQTRTGTGSANTVVTGVPFAPDLVIIDRRTSSASQCPNWEDRLRAATRYISSSGLAVESVGASFVSSFNQTGMTVGTESSINSPGAAFIDWYFKRAPGVFDEVCYTGVGGVANVTHSLGVMPQLIIGKSRSNSGDWRVMSINSTGVQYSGLFLNTTALADGPYTASSIATSTTFGASFFGNVAATTYVAYLFATFAGISKVGAYTGNGTSQTIDCGFTTGARFIMIKRTSQTGDWYVWDTARGIIAGNDPYLAMNNTVNEVTTDDSIDPDATGFIVNQTASTNINVSSATYTFLSFS